ncbi:MAG: leucine--tRNA ligase [Thermoproteota archaeon]
MTLDFKKIERKWQQRWEKSRAFEVKEDPRKRKYYVLEMYPYPSASFLHVGHVRNYTIGDVYARFKRMQGFNVLYPMGYDSFGLPAETAARTEGIHPKKYTEQAIKKIMEYQKALGNSYDWSRVISSHDPDYYKWNQYFFLKLYERGLAYKKKAPVNWCENCQSVLANEEAEGGRCWRCGGQVVKRNMEQWFYKITEYADRLLEDLDKIEWPERVKIMQRNWIGKSYGTEIDFRIDGEVWKVFTTRPDTIYGVTFMAISAQHPRLLEITDERYRKEVEDFVKRWQIVRTEEEIETLEKEGIFIGKYAIHPLTNERIPVYAANFVVAEYGSGMVMGVPAHDQRDFEFAKKYNIPIKVVIQPKDAKIDAESMKEAYTGEGILVNSDKFSGMDSKKAIDEITKYLEGRNLGRRAVNYKIRDWLISRQRYWGTPIPIIYCEKCGTVPVPLEDLPVLLPEKVDFKLGLNPLSENKEFLNVKCPKCCGPARRETDTMCGFVDSSWYFLRYCDNRNRDKPFDKDKVKYWMPVDQYIGGVEHAVMHLIYARFFVKVLKDMGFVDFDEPFIRLFNQGIVYKGGVKMSKSKGNVVYQTDISDKYGIDTLRLFLMSVASPDKPIEWTDEGVEWAFKIINKLIRLSNRIGKSDRRQDSKVNTAIKEVTDSIEKFNYPKAIASIVECINAFSEEISKENYETLLKLISPFCPHIAEELWEKLGNKGFISLAQWPIADESKIDKRFEEQERALEELTEDINEIAQIMRKKQNKEPKKVYIYVLPYELDFYREISALIERKTNLKIEIFSVDDEKKYDPQSRAARAKTGRPGIYLE